VGRQISSAFDGIAGTGVRVNDPYRLLAPDQLWLVYARTPDVRAAVDGIARRIATWAWTVEVELPMTDSAYDEASEAADVATRFLRAPNGNGETWQELMTRVVTDLLVYEQGAIEEVYSALVPVPLTIPGTQQPIQAKAPASDATLEELVALNGASVCPISDGFGRIYGYRQDVWTTFGAAGGTSFGDGPLPVFSRDQVVVFNLFPNTSGRTAPLIETIVNEVITIMRSSEHGMLAMDADEIPPGILVLTGVAGKAAEQAKTDIQRLRGKDHKIRVITNPDPKGSGAHWVELRRTPKDLSMIEVVREVRRTIWRIFGVMPIEMGDSQDMPRAVGQVQLDVASSHLVEPILDLLEAKVNARILPLLVGEDFAGKVCLRFDREAKLSPAEQQQKAGALVSLVREGILTRNEARAELDQEPIDGGDVATVALAGGLERVATLSGPGPIPGDETENEEPAPGEMEPEKPDEEAPGEIEESRRPAIRALNLPSAWPSAELFEGKRTVNLSVLAQAVAAYTAEVTPHFREAADEVIAAVSRRYDKVLRPEDAQLALRDVNRALDRLLVRWRAAVEPLYERVAKASRDRAVDYAKVPVLADWRERADAYGARAIGFLTSPGGLISDVRASVAGMVAAATGEPTGRSVTPADGIAPGMEEVALLTAIASVFASNEHRVENWSGKLVELASEVLTAGLSEGSAEAGEWYYEWVAVGDDRMCTTCASEGRQGFRPMSSLRLHPGSSTLCRARCRCVLVYWTRNEVQSGDAVSLSGAGLGNKPL
jgi:hypothetical protein